MEIKTIKKMERKAIKTSSFDFLRLGIALFFLVAVLLFSYGFHGNVPNNTFLAIAALFGAYMAMNIGANDVANNVGPAVGSKAMSLGVAIIIAAIFEAMGAILAGGEVVKTIKNGIIDPAYISEPQIFMWAMTAALLAGAIWLNIATFIKAPVSTTHSIVGGVMGAGIAAAGFGVVDWGQVGVIVSSWIVSPILGGFVAALFLYIIKKSVMFKEDKIEAAKKFVPILVAIMAWTFGTYIILKGLNQVIKVDFISASIIGLIIAIAVYFFVKIKIIQTASKLENTRDTINKLFTIPLIFAAALLSFAHGANDVANAIGPLAAINDVILNQTVSAKSHIPMWVMLVGAIGISLGLALYGPRLIKMVGSEITELDQTRAYSIAVSAALTVVIASQLGLPVSSTHIAIGGVFGVGFLREWLSSNNMSERIYEEQKVLSNQTKILKSLHKDLETLDKKVDKDKDDYMKIAEIYRLIDEEEDKIKAVKKNIKSAEKIKYVRRDAINKIIAAWVITVPATACLGAGLFFMIRGIMI